MKIKINSELKDLDGTSPLPKEPVLSAVALFRLLPENLQKQVIPYFVPKDSAPMTLRDVCTSSILAPLQEDDEKVKFNKYEIYKKVRDAKEEVTLTAEEIVVIKKAIGKWQPTLIMGQSFEFIEDKEKKQTK